MSKFLHLKTSLTALLILLNQWAFSQEYQWDKVALDDSTSIEFPGQPSKKVAQSHHIVSYQDDKAVYMVISQPDAYAGNPVDSVLNQFYTGALNGTIESAGGGEVVVQKPFVTNGFRGLEAQYIAQSANNLPRYRSIRLLLVNGTFYSENFWTNAENDPMLGTAREHFFSSFQTTVKRTAPIDPQTQTAAYRLGKLMGSLFFFGALAAVIVAIVRKFSKPKNSSIKS